MIHPSTANSEAGDAADRNGTLLLERTLNWSRQEHAPTYLATRVLAETCPPDLLRAWVEGPLRPGALDGHPQSYREHVTFKGNDRHGVPQYRGLNIGSPATVLSEVRLLARMARDAAFASHPSVYSFLLPRNRESRVFQYYFAGYRRRERHIAAVAAGMRDARILVLDLERYYPTIDTDRALDQFARRLHASTLAPGECDEASRLASGLVAATRGEGLPAGCPLSHYLAGAFLRTIDEAMTRRFPDRYFRYVDDTALVVERSEVAAAEALLSNLAEAEGLRVNASKTCVVAGRDWSEHMAACEARPDAANGRLTERVKEYLVVYPGRFDALRRMFRDGGLSLPFEWLRSGSESPAYLRHREGRGHITPARPEELLAMAGRVRASYLDMARRLVDAGLPAEGMARRWAVQVHRNTFDRLAGLTGTGNMGEIARLLPGDAELAERRTAIQALERGDATGLLAYPGKAVSIFLGSWSVGEQGRPAINWPATLSEAGRDAAATLAVHDLCELPPRLIARCRPADRRFLGIVSGRPARPRPFRSNSYLDEVEPLLTMAGLDHARLMARPFPGQAAFIRPAAPGSAASASLPRPRTTENPMIIARASRDWPYHDGKTVRTIAGADGEARFVGADVCRVLGHSNSRQALSRLDKDQKDRVVVSTPGGPQELVVITESGLYALMLNSRMPEAKRFTKWVTSEVLPALRKAGRYDVAPDDHDPILCGIRAQHDLRLAQLAHERLSSALAKAIEDLNGATLSLAPHARTLMDWSREQVINQPVDGPGSPQAMLASGGRSPSIVGKS